MKYLVIGLGIFGRNIAVDLTDIGAEVIGVDNRNETIDLIKDIVSTTYRIDASDETAIGLLPLKNIDVAIVTIGNNFEASIKTVALLKKNGVKRIIARAIDELHQSILEGLGVDKIITPERNAAMNLVDEFALGTRVSSFKVDGYHYIFQFSAPSMLYGRNYADLTSGSFYDLKLIAANRQTTTKNIIGMRIESDRLINIERSEERVQEHDVLTFFGSLDKFRHFYKEIAGDY